MSKEVHSFFKIYQPQQVSHENFDSFVEKNDHLKIIFMWGENCPNCEIAKNILVEYQLEVKVWANLEWYHANIYEDIDLARRFGLHGIPVFLVYKGSKKLGKISPFPGWNQFRQAIDQIYKEYYG